MTDMQNITSKIFLIFNICTAAVTLIHAQDTAAVVWPLLSTATVNATTTGHVLGSNEFFKNTEVNQYTGYKNSQRVRIVGNTWPLNQSVPIDTVYVQFSAKPKEGITFIVSFIKLYLAGNSGSSMRAKVYYSTDSTFTDKTEIYAGTVNLPNNTAFDSAFATPSITLNEGKSLHIRIYPWWHNQTGSNTGKYLLLQDVIIAGSTAGSAIVNLPTLSTRTIFNISTTFAISGGTISNDGGGFVTARGVCWDTVPAPTTAKASTFDGTGSGSYTSIAKGLLPGKLYYLRAYAKNSAGTAYGNEISVTTMAAKTIPILTTATVTNILATTATGGGNIIQWGGDSITVRGICWSTSTNPTTGQFSTNNGIGSGTFASAMTQLNPNTTYYVRAYATNGIGTGYGNEISFSTQPHAPDMLKVVAKDGLGDYTTVQSAFDAVPINYTGKFYIYVKKGTYKEKLLLPQNKVNVILVGENRDSTILTYDDYAGKTGGTSSSQSVAIDADDFVAMNLTFQNSVKNDGLFADQQAVALRVNGDRQAYFDCNILGYQDTYYAWGGRGTGRTYHKNCRIEGSVDFIFGRNIVVFDSCEIRINRNSGTLTAASTEASSAYGFVFLNSTITSPAIGFDGNSIASFSLGRPWQAAPRTVFIRCEEPANLNPAGWLNWNVTPALYAEYQCTGPGFLPAQRVAWSSQLTDSASLHYTIEKIFSKNSVNPAFAADWMPVKPLPVSPSSVKKNRGDNFPGELTLLQNYPNPFNPSTSIHFSVAEKGMTKISIYNVLGQVVAVPFLGMAEPGYEYHAQFTADGLASGPYFYSIESGRYRTMKKMLLEK